MTTWVIVSPTQPCHGHADPIPSAHSNVNSALTDCVRCVTAVTNDAELREIYRPPAPRVDQKVLDRLDVHCRNFIELSPFCVLSSSNADGQADTSPRGDPPGFVKVLDDSTLLPDRSGNNQVDSLQNIVGNPGVGLLFFVPRMNETLRVEGRAEITTDADLLDLLTVAGKAPLSGLKISVEEAFLHCGRALIRGRIWDADAQIGRKSYPTYGQVLADQITGADAREIDADENEANRERLY